MDYLQQVLGYKAEQIQRIEHVENYTMSFESGSITKAYLETPYLRIFLSQYEGYTAYGDTQQLGGFGFVSIVLSRNCRCLLYAKKKEET